VTKQVALVGNDERACTIVAKSGFTGYYLIRNWTDADSATANPPANTAAATNDYPHIEHVRLTISQNNGVTCIGWCNFQETAYIRDVILDKTADSSACRGIRIAGSVQGGEIRRVTVYAPLTGAPWGNGTIRRCHGADIEISGWTTAQNAHSDNVF